MAPISALSHLSNPLITSTQTSRFQSAYSDSNSDHRSTIYTSSQLTQAAGILLRLPQEVITTAIVLLQRYLIHRDSFGKEQTLKSSSAASIYLSAKLSFTPLSPRSVVNVYAYLTSPTASPLWFINPKPVSDKPDAATYIPSEGTYERGRQLLFTSETRVLTMIGFNTTVALPHTIALTYLSTLVPKPSSKLSGKVIAHLNTAVLSPQLLYLTHQPNALAVAAIYLAARETGTKLVDGNWWEVFDVDREDLGFLVLAMGSLTGFVKDLKDKGTVAELF